MVRCQGHASPVPRRFPRKTAERPALGALLAPSSAVASTPSGSRLLTSVTPAPEGLAVRRSLQRATVVLAVPEGAVPTGQAVPLPKAEAKPSQGAENGPPATSASISTMPEVVHAGTAATAPTKAPKRLPVPNAEGTPCPGATTKLTARMNLPIRPRPKEPPRQPAGQAHPTITFPCLARRLTLRLSRCAPHRPPTPFLRVVGTSRSLAKLAPTSSARRKPTTKRAGSAEISIREPELKSA